MIPDRYDSQAWTRLYLAMQSEGKITQPYVVLRPSGQTLEVIAQAPTYDGLYRGLDAEDVTGEIYVLWTRTAREEAVQRHGRQSPRLGPPPNQHQIEVDI